MARRANPIDDAAVIQEIRKKVGFHIHLRADANRKWSFDQALIFGSNVKDSALQYIEVSFINVCFCIVMLYAGGD